jgi:regulatory protein
LRRRLVQRGAAAAIADAVVTDLTARGYLDDAAFARHWVETRAPRGYGPRRLRAELLARGVAIAIVDAALLALAPDATLERARAAGRRRLPALRRGRPERIASRLWDYLRRRGYPDSMVARVVRELTGRGSED